MYENGVDFEKNIEAATNWYQKAADQGHEGAKSDLERLGLSIGGTKTSNIDSGRPLITGESNRAGTETATIQELKALAEQGNAYAQFNLGVMYNYGTDVLQDHKEAVKWYAKSAEQGFASAQLNLGLMYNQGSGVLQDYKEAVKWYAKGAEQGDAHSQRNLGVMFRYGKGVPQDFREAAKWFIQSANQGFLQAQNDMGTICYNGEGVIEDYVKAHMWFNLAAANGNDLASNNRDGIAKGMTSEQIAEAQKMAREWMEEHGDL